MNVITEIYLCDNCGGSGSNKCLSTGNQIPTMDEFKKYLPQKADVKTSYLMAYPCQRQKLQNK